MVTSFNKRPANHYKVGGARHSTIPIYRFRLLKNAAIELPIPKKNEEVDGFAPTAMAPPVAAKAIDPGSGTVCPTVLQLLMRLSSNVTAPLSAITLPQLTVAPVSRVSLAKAMRFP